MERFITLLIASLALALLFGFFTVWLLEILNQDASGPDARLGAAYLSTFGGFAAALFGFFLVWFLTSRFLLPQHLRAVQIFDAMAVLCWVCVYMIVAADGQHKLTYEGQQPVLEVELRATKTMLAGKSIDSEATIMFVGGTDLDNPHPDLVRDEGDYIILPWETVPLKVSDWGVMVFLRNDPLLFNLDLPKHPKASTDWSGWVEPVPFQKVPLPADAQQGLRLRYRFRLVPYGQ